MATATIYREIAIEVEYAVTPYRPATRSDPAEGGEVEIISATYDGKDFDLTREEMDELYEQAQNDWADREADRADRRYDEMRDRQMEREFDK